MELKSNIGFVDYRQLHAKSVDGLLPSLEKINAGLEDEFDAVASLSYRNQMTLIFGFLDPRTQIANIRLVKDEVRFIDSGRSVLMFGEEVQF